MPVVNANDLCQLNLLHNGVKETLWIDRGWGVGGVDSDKETETKLLGPGVEGVDYAEVTNRNLSTFYNTRKDIQPTPYATTTLINPSNRTDVSFFW